MRQCRQQRKKPARLRCGSTHEHIDRLRKSDNAESVHQHHAKNGLKYESSRPNFRWLHALTVTCHVRTGTMSCLPSTISTQPSSSSAWRKPQRSKGLRWRCWSLNSTSVNWYAITVMPSGHTSSGITITIPARNLCRALSHCSNYEGSHHRQLVCADNNSRLYSNQPTPRLIMSETIRQTQTGGARPRWELHSAGRTLGNKGRQPCNHSRLSTVQTVNCVWCPSFGVKHSGSQSRQSEVWGAITTPSQPTHKETTEERRR